MTESQLDDIIEHCKRVGSGLLQTWLSENDISLPETQENNLFASIREGLATGALKTDVLQKGIGEIEENSNKKIYLYAVKDLKKLKENLKGVLLNLRKDCNVVFSDSNYKLGSPSEISTFIYAYKSDDYIKLMYSEKHFEVEVNYDNNTVTRTPLIVSAIYIIDLNTGIIQLKIDPAGTIHKHKSETGKPSEAEFDKFYKTHLQKLLPDYEITEMNLNAVCNYIAKNERTSFRVHKGVSTITNEAKQSFTSASTRLDVRDLPEYKAAELKSSDIWRTEDIAGYWLASQSNGELKKDLFMRILRRNSLIRVQRGCLEKELNYGLEKIREIQTKISII